MRIREGESREARIAKRYVQLSATHAIGDTYDALVELITNADDSYGRLFRMGKRSRDGGDILIEHCARRAERSYVVVRDRAQGMDSERMQEVIYNIGEYSSDVGDRGFMGRGVKDCCVIGDLTFESIKDDRYYRCSLSSAYVFKNEVDARPVTKAVRERLGIPHRNGTSVTLRFRKGKSLARFETLASNLPNYYALRRILSTDSDSRVLLVKVGAGEDKKLRLVYHPPEGELVIEKSYQVEGYGGAMATLRIWRTPEPLIESKEGYRFERFGILVLGERGIYECGTLSDSLRSDHNTRLFHGEIMCPHIDALLNEYEDIRNAAGDYPETNNTILVDPNRKHGLNRQHPFTAALFRPAIAVLRNLLEQEKRRAEASNKQIANESTKRCLNRLARLAEKFLEPSEEASLDSVLDTNAFSNKGMFLFPEVLNVGVGRERTISIYLRKELAPSDCRVTLECDEPHCLTLSKNDVSLHPHKKRDDLLIGAVKISGHAVCPAAVVTASFGDDARAEAILRVVEITPEDWSFTNPLEFERAEYEVREGRTRKLRVLAKVPELVQTRTEATIWITGKSGVAIIGCCSLEPVPETNYAEGFVRVRGLKLKARSKVNVKVDGYLTTIVVKVVERERTGPPGRILIAEVVAESVCRRELVLDAFNNPGKFRWTGTSEHPAAVADGVLVELQRRMSDFLAEAHPIALRDLPRLDQG
jgi:hypothetical protein